MSGGRSRIATEIKLDKTINSLTYEFYRSVTPLGPGASDALNDSRAWTWKLLFVAEIAYVSAPPGWLVTYLVLTEARLLQIVRLDGSSRVNTHALALNTRS